jgi:RimJ/RimL family protein N-acetyltransferase
LLLRELTGSDVSDRYVVWMNDPCIVRFLESRFTAHTADDIREFMADVKSDPDSLMWAICVAENGEHIGNIKLGPVNWAHRFGEFGILIGERSTWGRGYAAEAISLVAEYALTDLQLHRLTATMYRDNLGSRKAFEKAGFGLEGTRISKFWTGDEYTDEFELTRFSENGL